MNQFIENIHPILCQDYAVFTPPINQMITTIGTWIDQRITGGYVYGPSRFGKSKAIKWYLRSMLEERFGQSIPLVIWNRRESNITEKEFWNSLLLASRYEFANPLKPKTKEVARYLFEQQLITLANNTSNNFIVLLIDEAHEVGLNEWKWLLGLQNSLDESGYKFSVFSIGSHGISFQPDYIARTGNAHISARFFSVDMRFKGISSRDELAYVLAGYDTDSEWPKDSKISYLQYFAPDDYRKGRRLEQMADLIWGAFIELLPQRPKIKLEIPMLHLSYLAENILKNLSQGSCWDAENNLESINKIISQTGYEDYIRMVILER